MSARLLQITDQIHAYLTGVSVDDSDLKRRLREETAPMPFAAMQISPEQGQLMGLLIELIGARRAIEIGTFTGYSALCVALALPDDGLLISCDVNAETTAIARRYWDEAGVAGKIDLRLGPAQETLDALLENGEAGGFDFIFIDADKENYDTYFERGLELLRTGGLIAIDNVLWGGKVADPTDTRESTEALRALNAKLHADPRVTIAMIPIGDGLTLARKR